MFKEFFYCVPPILKRQIILRLCSGAVLIICTCLIWHWWNSFYFVLPLLITAAIAVVSGTYLYYLSVSEKYIAVMGICTEVEYTPIRKLCKTAVIQTEVGAIRLILNRKRVKIKVGSEVRVFLSASEPIYEENGEYIVFSVLGLELFCSKSDKRG